jgi:hypothetical protein
MARIRTIKPEFWTSTQILECSPIARLLFIGLWNFCDDGGNHVASVKTIKAEIFPGDDISLSNVQELIDELSSNDLVVYYSNENKDFLHVTGWHHQKIDKPSYKHPPYKAEKSKAVRRTIVDQSPAEGNGMEGKGKEGIGENPLSSKPDDVPGVPSEPTLRLEPTDPPPDPPPDPEPDPVQTIFAYWQRIMNSPRSVLDDKRRKAIKAAIGWGYEPAQLCRAIRGCSKTPHNMGQNKQGQKYNGIELILRNADQIDRFIGNDASPPVALAGGRTSSRAEQSMSDFLGTRPRPDDGRTIEMEAP